MSKTMYHGLTRGSLSIQNIVKSLITFDERRVDLSVTRKRENLWNYALSINSKWKKVNHFLKNIL